MKKYLMPGLILILTGVYFLIEALPGVSLPSGAFFMLIGAALLIGRLCRRSKYGLTIAGWITFCLGYSWVLMDLLHIDGKYTMVATPLALSLAFFLTHICEYRRLGNWPIVPALVLLAFSTFFFLLLTPEVNKMLLPYYGTILPLLLIVIGVLLLLRGARDHRREKRAHAAAQNEPNPGNPATWAQPPLHEEPASEAAPASAPEAPTQQAAPFASEENVQPDPAPNTEESPVIILPAPDAADQPNASTPEKP